MRALLVLLVSPLFAAAAEVPVGEVMKFTFEKSKIFPGTTRTVWVYVPKQYDGKTPACLHVNQDGIQFGAVKLNKEGQAVEAGVLDALIAEKRMPITIGVFVTPGVVKSLDPARALDRFNRSFEYDGLGDAYARFLIEELLPEVETKTASDGRKIILSKDGNDRSIGGSSSGAIAAFTAAWERPDSFRRVFSGIGTYVGLRGGNEYPTIIRKFEPKPLRVFLEDGSADNNSYGGDWWMANQSMERSLKFMGYEVEHNWGTGGHNNQHATEIFPEAMAWLWKDHPTPVKTGKCQNDFINEILIPGEEWKLVGQGFKSLQGGMAVDDKGIIYVSDVFEETIYKLADGYFNKWVAGHNITLIECCGKDKLLYGHGIADRKIIAWDNAGKSKIIVDDTRCISLVITNNSSIYAVGMKNPGSNNITNCEIWHINSRGVKQAIHEGRFFPSAITVSPDQTLLYFDDTASTFVYSGQIQADGTIKHVQKYFKIHVLDTEEKWGIKGMRCDRDGRLWIATKSGLQVCDQAGRVHCIIPTPNGIVNGFAFGGPEFDILYAACGDKVYSRKVKVKGANAFEPPIKPEKPKL